MRIGVGRDELGEPARLRPLHAERRAAPRRARHGDGATSLYIDEATARDAELPAGAHGSGVVGSRETPSEAAAAGSCRRLATCSASPPRCAPTDLDAFLFPSVYTYFPVLGDPDGARHPRRNRPRASAAHARRPPRPARLAREGRLRPADGGSRLHRLRGARSACSSSASASTPSFSASCRRRRTRSSIHALPTTSKAARRSDRSRAGPSPTSSSPVASARTRTSRR